MSEKYPYCVDGLVPHTAEIVAREIFNLIKSPQYLRDPARLARALTGHDPQIDDYEYES